MAGTLDPITASVSKELKDPFAKPKIANNIVELIGGTPIVRNYFYNSSS